MFHPWSIRWQATMTPVSLTYIGGRTIGPYQLQAYAVEMRPPKGGDRFFPLVLTLVNGKVVVDQNVQNDTLAGRALRRGRLTT